ncbi:hypothetical protein ACWGLC_16255 [Dietzia sp. NPDC055877]
MAFTTEFVMGAGGGVEEIPVSMSGGGAGTVYPLTTVDAGAGAFILVSGAMTGSTFESQRPHLQIGTHTHTDPRLYLTGPNGLGIWAKATGTVQVAVLSRVTSTTTLTGTVYVSRL